MRPGFFAWMLALSLLAPAAGAADKRQVVAVFDIQVKRVRLGKAQKDMLTELMAQELGLGGIYQVMPPGDVKRVLLEQATESYKVCFDEKCQIELGRQLPADKLLTTSIMKIGGRCRLAGSLYDLRRQTTDFIAKEKCKCTEVALAEAVEKVAAKIRAWGGDTGPGVALPLPDTGAPEKPLPDAGDREYQRSLNQAWRKLARSVRKGSAEENLEKYQKFLADFPADNPHEQKVQKAIDALDARFEKEDTARREAEERKAALEAKRARAREIQQAYDRTKQTKGSASTQFQAWESFVSDYPEDNPYLKTARRKVKTLERRAEAEAREEAKRTPEGMARVPAGEFWMGCNPKVDSECGADEKPGRKVRLDAFVIDKTEVTVDQYGRCVQAGRCKKPKTGKYYNWEKSGRGRHPVNGVDWNDAKSYCEWTGKRLPTEAEWEKAARGTDGRKYPWGNQKASCAYAVMDDKSTKGSAGDETDGCGENRTWSVCSKERGNSPFGLCDMAGNVWEWVADWYGKGYYSGGPRRNPSGAGSGKSRVVRGGSWLVEPDRVRASPRAGAPPGTRDYDLGFRCARPAAR